jgi:hypothetical protein
MSAAHRAEVDARWRDFVGQLRGCRVRGDCEHCEKAVSEFRAWAEGREEDGKVTVEHGGIGV